MLRNYAKAASLFGKSVELNRRIGDRGMVMAELNNLGLVEIHRNHIETAERLFEESEKVFGKTNESPYGTGMAFLYRAMVAYGRGHSSSARSFLTRAKSTFKRARIEPATDDKFEFDWLEQKLTEMKSQGHKMSRYRSSSNPHEDARFS